MRKLGAQHQTGWRRARGVLAAALIGIAAAPEANAIERGTLASARDRLARATVAVGAINSPGRALRLNHCTGVLIGPDLVLTAAHCVRDDPVAAGIRLYRGSEPIASLQRVSAVATTAIEPGALPSTDLVGHLREVSYDIAVLRLAAPIRDRKPLPLVRNPRQLPPLMRLAGVGWSEQATGTLKTASVKPLLITDTGVVIARAMGAQVCVGDSGGPVVVDSANGPAIWGVAAAIISPGVPCSDIVVIAPAGGGGVPPPR
jgi:hypothetical protein